MAIEYKIGQKITLRKKHPCGGFDWIIVRLGADIGLACCTCGHKILLARHDLAKRIKSSTLAKETYL